jgi:uncharacterized membrane protein YphA (DoxX/SURF4 family)
MQRFDELLGRTVSLRALDVLRIPVGIVAVLHLKPFLERANDGFVYRDAFYEPYAAWYPELPRALYVSLLWIGLVAAIAMVVGVAARIAAAVTFAVVTYNLFLSTTHFHNNRAYLVIVLGTLAVAARSEGPGWPLWLLRFEAAAVYGASGLSKVLDPDWFDGTVAWDRVVRHRDDLSRALPEPVVSILANRSFESVAAKVIIATELLLAVALWSRRTRYAAVWVAVCFHLAIEVSSSVEVFSYLAISVLLVWAVPSTRDRIVVLDPTNPVHVRAAAALRAFDWLARFRVEHEPGAPLTVVDRDGATRRGTAATVFVASRLPVSAFFALPLLLLPANRPSRRVLVSYRT